jgi:transcription elongation factor SPT5
MSSAALLDQDFGSESEDETFNPAPAEDSENDAGGDSDGDRDVTRKISNAQGRRRGSSAQSVGNDHEKDATHRSPTNGVHGAPSNEDGAREPRGEKDEGAMQNRDIGSNGAAAAEDGEEEEEEDEEDEEEEEEAVSVRTGAVLVS